jgi:hypothetical protein
MQRRKQKSLHSHVNNNNAYYYYYYYHHHHHRQYLYQACIRVFAKSSDCDSGTVPVTINIQMVQTHTRLTVNGVLLDGVCAARRDIQ